MTTANIISSIAVLTTIVIVVWIKMTTSRIFTDLDNRIESIKKGVHTAIESSMTLEKEIIRLQEFRSSATDQFRQIQAAAVREAQIMSNQLEAIYNKIEHLDGKLDNVRDTRR